MELQLDVYDELGLFVGRVDGGFPELGIIWEYDGQGKYGQLLPPGRTAADALLAQKRREDRLIQLGWVVIRVDHTDLPDLSRFFDRLSQAILSERRYGWKAPTERTFFALRSLSGEATEHPEVTEHPPRKGVWSSSGCSVWPGRVFGHVRGVWSGREGVSATS